MSEPEEKRHYIRRQLRAGPNCGKWAVYAPTGKRLVVGETKSKALLVCAAFTLAAECLEAAGRGELAGEIFASEVHVLSATPGFSGKVYPLFSRRSARRPAA